MKVSAEMVEHAVATHMSSHHLVCSLFEAPPGLYVSDLTEMEWKHVGDGVAWWLPPDDPDEVEADYYEEPDGEGVFLPSGEPTTYKSNGFTMFRIADRDEPEAGEQYVVFANAQQLH